MQRKQQFILTLVLSAGMMLMTSAGLRSEEYKVGSDDVLEISFWQDPGLNTQVKVSQEGTVTLDIIGQITVADKTTRELSQEIVRKMSRFNQQISQAVVRVLQYNHNYVYVTGQVRAGGKLTFEAIPNLWTIINEAGGLTELADLSRVTIIRGGQDAGKVEVVNVRQALATGKLDKLPKIGRGDTIEIPRNPASVAGGDLVQQATRKNLIYVLGAVGRPGPIAFEDNTDILDALALAGGATPDADLKHATIVTRDGAYGQTLSFDLEKFMSTGRPARYVLRREDTFIVPRQSGGLLGGGATTLAALLGTISSALLIGSRF